MPCALGAREYKQTQQTATRLNNRKQNLSLLAEASEATKTEKQWSQDLCLREELPPCMYFQVTRCTTSHVFETQQSNSWEVSKGVYDCHAYT